MKYYKENIHTILRRSEKFEREKRTDQGSLNREFLGMIWPSVGTESIFWQVEFGVKYEIAW